MVNIIKIYLILDCGHFLICLQTCAYARKHKIFSVYAFITQPLDGTQGQFFRRSKAGLKQFSYSYIACLNKPKEPSMFYYLPTAGGQALFDSWFPKGISVK